MRSAMPRSRIGCTRAWTRPCARPWRPRAVRVPRPLPRRLGPPWTSPSGRISVASVRAPMADCATRPWQRLAGAIAPDVLCAPRTAGDPLAPGDWPDIHERLVGYLERNVIGRPWADHLALAVAVMMARRRDVGTVRSVIQVIHTRFGALFPALGLRTMADWQAEHVIAYLKAEWLPDDRQSVRARRPQGAPAPPRLRHPRRPDREDPHRHRRRVAQAKESGRDRLLQPAHGLPGRRGGRPLSRPDRRSRPRRRG